MLVGVADALEQDMFLCVLVLCVVGISGVRVRYVGIRACDNVIGTWVESEGVSHVEGVACGPSKDGGRGKSVMRCGSCTDSRWGCGV